MTPGPCGLDLQTMTTQPDNVTTATNTDKRRWAALYVLCGGMLMIVLDATIVNVALPSIQDDLGFSQSSLAWVVNAYLIAFGGLLLLAGRIGDLIGTAPGVPHRAGGVHRRVAGVRHGPEPGCADRRALRAGGRRRHRVGGDPRDDRDHVPGAPGAGEGDRRVQLRGVGRRLDRAARGRPAHRGHQLALDLLHQPARGTRDRRAGPAAGRGPRGHRPRPGRRHSRRGAAHRRPDARRVHAARGRASRAGDRPRRWGSERWRSRCWRPSSLARRAWPTR